MGQTEAVVHSEACQAELDDQKRALRNSEEDAVISRLSIEAAGEARLEEQGSELRASLDCKDLADRTAMTTRHRSQDRLQLPSEAEGQHHERATIKKGGRQWASRPLDLFLFPPLFLFFFLRNCFSHIFCSR